jgi:1-acyl-sn-glycerol-3-phosphate acyltransferase
MTNKLYSSWVVAQSIFYTLADSLNVLIRACIGKISRENIERCVRRWSAHMLSAVKLTYTVVNPENGQFLPHRSYIIMSNHSSLYDIPLIFMSFSGSIRMLAKKELFRVPIWGAAMRQAEFISVDRQQRVQAVQDLALARQKMESGIILWIAPEGTRSRTKRLLPLKKGCFTLAMEANAIIIPVGIRGVADVLPAGTLNFHVGRHVEVHIGKPIDTADFATKSREQLMLTVASQLQVLADLKI